MKYIVSINSTVLTRKEIELLKNKDVSSVILYGKNILSKETTQKLIKSIKSINKQLKIFVDEEGGIVSRFQHLLPNYSQPYCSTISTEETRNYYKNRSHILKDIGIDVNLAPIVDLALNEQSVMYKRSYGDNLKKVVELAKICIEEQEKAGIESCIKHFPGHGLTTQDSHEELPTVDINYSTWGIEEGHIFKELVNFGVKNILVGHLMYPKISDQITSVSDYWINKVLREKLKYKGKVILDDICMKGFPQDITSVKLENLNIDEAIVTEQDHKFLKDLK